MRGVKVQWDRFRSIWSQSTWVELGTLSYLACITAFVQFILFFWLMHDWPGMTKYSCEKLRYISENIELNKGKSSIMVATVLPSFAILGIMNAYERPILTKSVGVRWLTRPIVNFFAVIAYSGCVGVVLFDQQISVLTEEQKRQHDMHILSALLLSCSYVIIHLLTTYKFKNEFIRLGKMFLEDATYQNLLLLNYFVLVYACINIAFLVSYCLSYLMQSCDETTVYFEYVLYVGTAVFNILVYFQFSLVHVLAKIDFMSLFTPGIV